MKNEKNLTIIKPTKIFCRNRIQLKCEGSPLTVWDHKVLDFLLFLILKEGVLQVQFSPCDFFEMAGLIKANGKQHKIFYDALNRLYDTSIFWINEKYTTFTHLLLKVSFHKTKKKINSIVVHLNPELSNVLIWKGNNIRQNIRITMALKRKYSYFLYMLLSRDYIMDGKVHIYRLMQLRNCLVVNEKEIDKHFKIYLRAAVKELNLIAGWDLTLKIRKNIFMVQNKTSSGLITEPDKDNNRSMLCPQNDFVEYDEEYKKFKKMYDVLKDYPEIGEIIDEQTRKRRREL